jgi:hypothetical protein
MKDFKFSIYDYNNRFNDLWGTGNTGKVIFTGPHENEMKYGYMRPGFDAAKPETWPSGGGSAGKPYFAEFRVQPDAGGALPTGAVIFKVKGAKAVWDDTQPDGSKWQIESGGSPAAEVWHDIGVLSVEDIEEATPYRIAFSDNKYKFFKVEVDPAATKVSAFLMRG